MAQIDPVLVRELPVIQRVIEDETWYESERRGRPVPADDPAVREHVCEVILRIGREMRERLAAELSAEPGPRMRSGRGAWPDGAA